MGFGFVPHVSLWWLFLVTVIVRGRGTRFWTWWSIAVLAAVSDRGRGGSWWVFVVMVADSAHGSCSCVRRLVVVAVL